ncbi:MAG TPA: hypothetical protein VLJ88_00465 [Propionibacteriaceae bacterium]|nr:hypothetical protein [Propionibacteriaceae bacterium]
MSRLGPGVRLNHADFELAFDLANNGHTVLQISAVLNVSPAVVRRSLANQPVGLGMACRPNRVA